MKLHRRALPSNRVSEQVSLGLQALFQKPRLSGVDGLQDFCTKTMGTDAIRLLCRPISVEPGKRVGVRQAVEFPIGDDLDFGVGQAVWSVWVSQGGQLAKNMGPHPVSLAVAWVGGHLAITSPIIGARNVEQLEPLLLSVGVDMTSDLRAKISALSPAPRPANDRLEDQVLS